MENQECHKPLILNGVRQCDKTYILKEFGRAEFASGITHIYYYSSGLLMPVTWALRDHVLGIERPCAGHWLPTQWA